MKGRIAVLAAILVFAGLVYESNGDCYMHNPRGSNNRLNERSANRNNANRLFDSQNNNRGGYNTGDKTDQAFSNEEGIYYMKYFQGGSGGKSLLTAEWTNQHGCGGNDGTDPHKLNCNLVIQYMCQTEDESVNAEIANNDQTKIDVLRDGQNTGTQNYQAPNKDESETDYNNRKTGRVQLNRGLHEPFSYYDDCYIRERNSGLFLADQTFNRREQGNLDYFGARFTRQNPNANRRGYECPEERDYYPYWHPTPWKDIAVLVDNATLCPWYESQSFNVQPRYLCKEKFSDTGNYKPYGRWNNESACTEEGGEWLKFYNYLEIDETKTSQPACESVNTQPERKWGRPYPDTTEKCLILLSAPDCQQSGWTRVNHLGNSKSGVPLNYTLELPSFTDNKDRRCVLRIRYNISTDDYDPVTTNSSYNENAIRRIRSPVTQNPYVDVGSNTNGPLRLAINTAQFGRTFQDRSHVFMLNPRPTQASLTNAAGVNINNANIYMVNVRGKRGNIVQVYPAVEYDFIPNRLEITEDDLIHFQWTGSNTHDNQNPAGDGQAGDAGEGRGGTDRHNIVEISKADMNYPVPFENSTLFNAQVVWYDSTVFGEIDLALNSPDRAKNLALLLSSAGYYQCFISCTDSVNTKNKLNNLLDNAYPSFYGPILKFPAGTYHYICSRNNNFTNRSQKGLLIVRASA